MNTCTHSYSAAWWDWTRWERKKDGRKGKAQKIIGRNKSQRAI